MKCIGYMGVEAFDIILYIARTIVMLNYPILIIDLSETGALAKAIYHGMDLDSENGIIHYRNLNYIRKMPEEDELKDYDKGVVFIVYGLNYVAHPSINLDYINIITDPFPNHIDQINILLNEFPLDSMKVKILVRDIISLNDLERVKYSIKLAHNPYSIKYLYFDINDRENAIECQISQLVRFRRISSKMKNIIISETGDVFANIKLSRIRKAFFYAKKGGDIR